MEVNDKVAIVTGASSGIGSATAKLLGKKGAKVALVARSKEKLLEISSKIPDSFVVVADMTVEKDIKEMVGEVIKHYGRVDILINNAGRGYRSNIEGIDSKKFHELFDLIVSGPLIAMQCVIPQMKKQGGGAIVNISSRTSSMYIPNLAAYSSLKRALNGISLTAREELKKDNIVVSVVYPYFTNTNFPNSTMTNDAIPNPQFLTYHGPSYQEGDPPELVAEKILEIIKSGDAEITLHESTDK